MHPGAVIIDMAAETGGNCELTQAGKTIHEHGVTIIGPQNLPARLCTIQLYSFENSDILH